MFFTLFRHSHKQSQLLILAICLCLGLLAAGCGHSGSKESSDAVKVSMTLKIIRNNTSKSLNEERQVSSKEIKERLEVDFFKVVDGKVGNEVAYHYSCYITPDQTKVIIPNVPSTKDGVDYLLCGELYREGSSVPTSKFQAEGQAKPAVKQEVVAVLSSGVLESLEVTPIVSSIAMGTSRSFKVIGYYSDKTVASIPQVYCSWTSSDELILSVTEPGTCHGEALGQCVLTVKDLKQDVDAVTMPIEVIEADVAKLAISPESKTIELGSSFAYTATAEYTDGSTKDVSREAQWKSSDESIAAFQDKDNPSTITGLKQGIVAVTATFNGFEAGAKASVANMASLTSITVSTDSAGTLPKGLSKQFTAMGTYSDNSKKDITKQVSWKSSNNDIATISNLLETKGLATGISLGKSNISASLGSVTSNLFELEISNAIPVSISITPSNQSLTVVSFHQLKALAVLSDDKSSDITKDVIWTTSDKLKVTVSNEAGSKGLVKGFRVGKAQIFASFGDIISSPAVITVVAPSIAGITITNSTNSNSERILPLGFTEQYSAFAIREDNSKEDITDAVNWSCSIPGIATISTSPGSKGLLSTISSGRTTINASYVIDNEAFSAQAALKVVDTPITSIAISDGTNLNFKTSQNQEMQLKATATLSDNSTTVMTRQVSWESQDTSKATVGNGNTAGLVYGVLQGNTGIKATVPSTTPPISDTKEISITAPIVRIKLIPDDAIAICKDLQSEELVIGAIATYSDGTSAVLTNAKYLKCFSFSDPSILSFIYFPLLSPQYDGSTDITFSCAGVTSNTVTAIVSDSEMETLSIDPQAATLNVGESIQLIARTVLTDGTEGTRSCHVNWTVENGDIAEVNNSYGTCLRGTVKAKASGTTTITAKYGSLSDTFTLTVPYLQ